MITFTIERRRHEGFVGRDGLLAQLDALLVADRIDRWVVVTGGPGTGKSAVLAAWLARREAAGDTIPHHFIRRGWANWDDPAAMVGSLVAQLEARFPDAGEPDPDAQLAPAARMAAALLRTSERALVPRGERLVLLIDGLDEYDPRPESMTGDPLAAFLPYALPRGVSVLCASRPRDPYVDSLATRGVLVQIDLDDAQRFAADNEATVRAFWEQAAPELGLEAPFIARAVERAGGNMEHAAMLRRQLAGMSPYQRRADDVPRGLVALIASAWERIAADPTVVDGLGILCAARESLTLDELGRVARWTGAASRQTFVRGAREWLIETRRTDSLREYRLHHDAIRAHVTDAIGSDALASHHLALAERLATWPAPADAAGRRYALRHALLHRAEAGTWADAWRIAADVAFLEAKFRELGSHDAELDVARMATRSRASGDEAHGERFADLARALGRESHWLWAAPEATAALVWNRLRRHGWTEVDLDAQLRVPKGAEFLRVRHAATRESPALVRNLAGHTQFVTACAVMPDGRHVVSASEDQTLKIWDLASGRAVATLVGHTGTVTACAVTLDGRHVISGSVDQTLKVWELASARVVATLEGHERTVTACAVTPDGRHVISASWDRTLKVWELASGRTVATLRGHTSLVNGCAVTADGRHVISAADDQTLKVWELGSGRAVATLKGHTGGVKACAVAANGRYVVSASYDHTLRLWELGTGRAVATLEGHTSAVTSCAVTSDGQHVISASWDQTLTVWELESGRAMTMLEGHTGAVSACAVTPDDRHIVSASNDQTLKVWELVSRRRAAMLVGPTFSVTACVVTSDGRRVISASYGRLKVWDLTNEYAVATLKCGRDELNACAVTPDGRYVVSASEARLKIWDLASGLEMATLQGHTGKVNACAVTPDGLHVVSASDDKTLKVWELASACALATLKGHTNDVTACAVTPDGLHVVSASNDKTLKVWELVSGRAVASFDRDTDEMTARPGMPHGRHLFYAPEDETPRGWELDSRIMVEGPIAHDRVNACAVTPDGLHVVLASDDKTLKIWDLVSGRAVATLEGHTDTVNACAVMPDGRHVVSASSDKTLKVWDLASYTCRITHRGDAGYLAIAVNATTIVAGDTAGAVWFLEGPRSNSPHRAAHDEHRGVRPIAASFDHSPSAPRPPMKHTILYLAANPLDTDRLALDEECAAIERELRMTSSRDDFDFRSKWAVSVDELMRHLNELQPSVLHFSGHGTPGDAGSSVRGRDVQRNLTTGARSAGIFLQEGQSRQFVSDRALAKLIASAAPSTRVVVLNACYSAAVAESLRHEVDCVVGIDQAIADPAARSFAVAFYRALGHRRSIGNAVEQAAATLEAKHPGARPMCATRDGLEADHIFLPAAGSVPDAGAPRPREPAASPPRAITATSRVDVGILTILEDEFRAVLAAFPDRNGSLRGTRTNREYSLHRTHVGGGAHYTLALLRQIEQGNGEAQSAARDLIEDLAPRLILVVGIAGGIPSASVTLGDVVLATRIHDFTVEARAADEAPTYATTGGPVSKALAAAIANLPARDAELGDWARGLPTGPPLSWDAKDQLYGPKEWQVAVRAKLERDQRSGPRPPIYVDGPIASSDRLVKDPALLIPWLQTARKLVAVEMESGGVYRAAQDRCSMLAIRGISDIVGLKRSDAWAKYACASAAAFTRAFLRTRPVGDPA